MKPAVCVAIALIVFAHSAGAQQPSEPLPASTLPLRLVGVANDATTPARSAAFIQCGDPQEKRAAWLFVVGDRACDVAEVTEVRADAVVIRNLLANRLELLTLPKPGATAASPPSAPNDAPVEPEPEAPLRPVVQTVSADVVMVELSKALIQRSMANLPEVLTSALATPRPAAGGSGSSSDIEGWEMSRIRSGGLVEQLGLRDGDVLLEFNGQKLNSLAAVTGMFGQAQALDGAKMTVLRRGRRMTFVFSVK